MLNVYKIKAYAESEACDSASVVPIHTRSEVSSDSDSAYDSASVASVASENQPLSSGAEAKIAGSNGWRMHVRCMTSFYAFTSVFVWTGENAA